MERSFWEERWQNAQIGFHEGHTNARLAHARDALFQGSTSPRVLVPLCGKAHDLVSLAEQGAHVVGCEIVRSAIEAFFSEQGLVPTIDRVGPFNRFASGPYTILEGDVFALTASITGPIDAAYDRAALIALNPEDRPRYANLVLDLLPAHGKVLVVTLEHDRGSGPPFSVMPEDIAEIYGARADHVPLERVALGDAELRGGSFVREASYLVTKR